MGPSIPLRCRVLMVPVQLGPEIEEKNEGWVQLRFDLELGTAEHGNIVFQGEAKLILQHYNKVMSSFSLNTKITSCKRKSPMPSDSAFDADSDFDAFKIDIMVTPFRQPESFYDDDETEKAPMERELL